MAWMVMRRTDNIFKELDSRQLTDEEQNIIKARVRAARRGPAAVDGDGKR